MSIKSDIHLIKNKRLPFAYKILSNCIDGIVIEHSSYCIMGFYDMKMIFEFNKVKELIIYFGNIDDICVKNGGVCREIYNYRANKPNELYEYIKLLLSKHINVENMKMYHG